MVQRASGRSEEAGARGPRRPTGAVAKLRSGPTGSGASGPAPTLREAPPVEVGLVIDPSMREADLRRSAAAASKLASALASLFPEFAFRVATARAEPDERRGPADAAVRWLDVAARELDAGGLDYALCVTADRLGDARGRPVVALASQLLSCGAVSLAGLPEMAAGGRLGTLAHELARLLATLAGVIGSEEEAAAELWVDDGRLSVTRALRDRWKAALDEVADARLEELPSRLGRFAFYWRAAAINARDIARTLQKTRPWLFPVRLSRLMTSAVSASLVLLMTAEAWQLSQAQSLGRLIALAAVALLGSAAYLRMRQDPMGSARTRSLSELRVTAEVAMSLGILLGMATTLVSLFFGAFSLSKWLYPPPLVEDWVRSGAPVAPFAKISLLSSALGIAIGGLGASFEAPAYFRFVLVVDQVSYEAASARRARN